MDPYLSNSQQGFLFQFCLSAYQKGLLTLTTKPKTAFLLKALLRIGRRPWNIFTCMMVLVAARRLSQMCSVSAPSITQQLSKAAAKNAAENRRVLLKTISSLRLLRQGLSIRGHKEEEGNLFQLLSLRIADDP